jgi:hypothetical protein
MQLLFCIDGDCLVVESQFIKPLLCNIYLLLVHVKVMHLIIKEKGCSHYKDH